MVRKTRKRNHKCLIDRSNVQMIQLQVIEVVETDNNKF